MLGGGFNSEVYIQSNVRRTIKRFLFVNLYGLFLLTQLYIELSLALRKRYPHTSAVNMGMYGPAASFCWLVPSS